MKRVLLTLLLIQASMPSPARADDNGKLMTGLGVALGLVGAVAIGCGVAQHVNSDDYLINGATSSLDHCKSQYGHLCNYTHAAYSINAQELQNLYSAVSSYHTSATSLRRNLCSDIDSLRQAYANVTARLRQRENEYADYAIINRLARVRDALNAQIAYLDSLYAVIKAHEAVMTLMPYAYEVIDAWQQFTRYYGSSVYNVSESTLHSYVQNNSNARYKYIACVQQLTKIIDAYESGYSSHSLGNYSIVQQANGAWTNLKEFKRALVASYGHAADLDRKREDERREREVRAAEEQANAARRQAQAAQDQADAARRQAQAARDQADALRAQQARGYQQPAQPPVLEVNVHVRS